MTIMDNVSQNYSDRTFIIVPKLTVKFQFQEINSPSKELAISLKTNTEKG